jgi:hypothetical protein
MRDRVALLRQMSRIAVVSCCLLLIVVTAGLAEVDTARPLSQVPDGGSLVSIHRMMVSHHDRTVQSLYVAPQEMSITERST